MDGRFALYELLQVVTVVVVVPVAIYTWNQRENPGAKAITAVLLGVAGWAGSSLAESLFRGSEAALVATRLIYVFVPIITAGLLVFALIYTNRDRWLGPRTYALLAVEPVVINVLAWTNADVWWTVRTTTDAERIGWELVWGPAFYGHTAYTYLVLATATVLFVEFATGTERLYKRQVSGILISVATPWIANALYLLSLLDRDPTPIALGVTGVGVAWLVWNERMLELTPIARDTVVETITDAVIVIDENGTVVDSNRATSELFENSPPQVGKQFERFLPDDDRIREAYRTLLAADEQRTVELEVADRYVTVDASPLEDVRGERIGTVLVVHDVTEQKERELELRRRNEQLDQFARVVSHDLRNPLQVATGSLDLAHETGEEEYFDRVERAHDRMEWLIDDLLALAREGDRLGDRSAVSIESVARDAWGTVRTPQASLSVTADATVRADPNRLRQLFENLFRNAVEHGSTNSQSQAPEDTAEHAGPEVTVEATASGFVVSDDGPGMPASIRDEINRQGRVSDPDRSGIGLTVVSAVVEAHDWMLHVTNGESGGARFEISGVDVLEADVDPATEKTR